MSSTSSASSAGLNTAASLIAKALTKAMGPFGVPAEIFLGTFEAALKSQKDEVKQNVGATVMEIEAVVATKLRQQDARAAWAKMKPACSMYLRILDLANSDGSLRPSEQSSLDDLANKALGANSSLREGMNLAYNADYNAHDMHTAQYTVPIYLMATTVELCLMVYDIHRKAQLNGSISERDWRQVAEHLYERTQALKRIADYVRIYTIEKILRDEFPPGKAKPGDPRIQKRHDQLYQSYLGSKNGIRDTLFYFYRMLDRLRDQSDPDILEQVNQMILENRRSG